MFPDPSRSRSFPLRGGGCDWRPVSYLQRPYAQDANLNPPPSSLQHRPKRAFRPAVLNACDLHARSDMAGSHMYLTAVWFWLSSSCPPPRALSLGTAVTASSATFCFTDLATSHAFPLHRPRLTFPASYHGRVCSSPGFGGSPASTNEHLGCHCCKRVRFSWSPKPFCARLPLVALAALHDRPPSPTPT